MVLDHGCSKRFLGRIAALLRNLTGLDLELVAGRSLLHEVRRRGADAEGGIYSSLLGACHGATLHGGAFPAQFPKLEWDAASSRGGDEGSEPAGRLCRFASLRDREQISVWIQGR